MSGMRLDNRNNFLVLGPRTSYFEFIFFVKQTIFTLSERKNHFKKL